MTFLLTLLACAETSPLGTLEAAEPWDTAAPDAPLGIDPAERPRNLIVISIDTLRQDALGHYSADADTPFLDTLADQALVLEDHRSCASWTLPSMTCFFSGQGLLELGYEPESRLGPESGIPADFAGLPQWLADAGYQTALVPTNAFVSDKVPLANGFQDVLRPDDHDEPGTARAVVDLATEWLDDHPWSADGPPSYLHLHRLDAHHPYTPPEDQTVPFPDDLPVTLDDLEDMDALERQLGTLDRDEQRLVTDYLKALYTAEIRSMDDQLARLWDTLDEQGRLDDTLVLVFADHGEGFNEHGHLEHGDSLFGELTQVPALFWARGLEGRDWHGPTTHADLAPTVLSILGEQEELDASGYPVGAAPLDRIRFSLRTMKGAKSQVAADLNDHVLHYNWSGELALHDLESDPQEQVDVYSHDDPLSQRLWGSVADAVAEMSTWQDMDEAVAPDH
jgi:arylsulfatase A-like enzyme